MRPVFQFLCPPLRIAGDLDLLARSRVGAVLTTVVAGSGRLEPLD